MKKTLFCLIALGLILAGCSKLIKIQTYEYNIKESVSKEQIKNAILVGCEKRGWLTKEKDENTIFAKLLNRNFYEVYVDIIYDTSSYKIVYVKSTNLNETISAAEEVEDNIQIECNRLHDFIDGQLYKFNIDGSFTKEQIKTAILIACKDRDWKVTEKDENTISAEILKNGNYEIFLDIVYDDISYKFENVKSVNLSTRQDDKGKDKDENEDRKINKAYAKWVGFLHESIDAELFKIEWK